MSGTVSLSDGAATKDKPITSRRNQTAIARLFSSSQFSNGQAVNGEGRTRWRKTHSAVASRELHQQQQQQRHFFANRRSLEQRVKSHSLTIQHNVVYAGDGRTRQRKTAVYSRDFPVEGTSASQFPGVGSLIKMYANMLAERKSDFAEQKMRAKSEGMSVIHINFCVYRLKKCSYRWRMSWCHCNVLLQRRGPGE